jgi:pyruvate,water dikinase
MMGQASYVRWFSDLGLTDVPLVGGKNASLGELYSTLTAQGVRVPQGFALTAEAYREALTAADVLGELRSLLSGFDYRDLDALAKRAAKARQIVYRATGGSGLREHIAAAYGVLEGDCGKNVAVAVRSSATAEDLPNASFAGQHESFLNVRGEAALFEACRRCFASILSDGGGPMRQRENSWVTQYALRYDIQCSSHTGTCVWLRISAVAPPSTHSMAG